MMNERRKYYDAWYRTNRDRILKQKRELYLKNHRYRLRILLGRRLNAALEMFSRFIKDGTIYVRSYGLSRFIGVDTRLIPGLIPVHIYLSRLADFVSMEGRHGRKERHDEKGGPDKEEGRD